VQEEGSQAPHGLSARFKELSRKYGWAAVGVYFGLSALDFPFCFLAVRLVGPDRIGEVEHAIVDGFWHVVAMVAPSMAPKSRQSGGVDQSDGVPAASSDIRAHKVKEDASMCHRNMSFPRGYTDR
jgi:N-terminal acetyltransferase 2